MPRVIEKATANSDIDSIFYPGTGYLDAYRLFLEKKLGTELRPTCANTPRRMDLTIDPNAFLYAWDRLFVPSRAPDSRTAGRSTALTAQAAHIRWA